MLYLVAEDNYQVEIFILGTKHWSEDNLMLIEFSEANDLLS